MSYRGIGDNSAPYGEELRADLEQILSENTENLFIYAQWHVGDYIAGTEGMPLEIEGAYQRFLMRLYRRGKPLPDDDSFMTAAMSLSTRVWRRIKTALIELGKIVVRCGCLTNPRFEKERLKRAEQLRKRAFAAHVRWQQERENRAEKPQPAAPISLSLPEVSPKFAPSLPEVSPKFAPSLPEVSPKFAGNFTQNTNKINEPQHAYAYANHKPLTINQEPIEDKPYSTTLRVRTREELDHLRARLREAGGTAINEAHPGFMTLAEPQRWLDGGCELESDIVPAIQKVIAGKKFGKITSWAYFTDAIQEARDRRLMPMASPVARVAQPGQSASAGRPANPNFSYNGTYIGQVI